MLDWKILAASVVALVFISSLFLGGFGIVDSITGIFGKLGESVGNPFTGLTAAKDGGGKEISILLSPSEVSFHPDSEVSLHWEQTSIQGFKGDINISLSNNSLSIKSPPLHLVTPLTHLEIDGISLKDYSLSSIPFEIQPDISTNSGSLHIQGFSGKAVTTERGLLLTGTVAKLRVTIGKLNLELV